MILSIIAAVGENNETGCRNELPWRLPADLRRFKELTVGHPVVMGRKTFESLPNGPLPGRQNIVLSRNPIFTSENCIVFSSLTDALIKLSRENEVFIIGGSQIYRQVLPYADKLYLTRVHACFPEADVFFPEFDRMNWKKVNEIRHPADEQNMYSFTFYEFEKKVIR
jgi:dihydrofolate reductase